MPGVAVHAVYNPPTEPFVLPALGNSNLPHIVIGNFNSHNTTCEYPTTDDDGNVAEQCEDLCNLTFIHNAKLPKSFNSARWKKGYNSNIIFASSSIADMWENSVMEPIPHTQHRPICVHVNMS